MRKTHPGSPVSTEKYKCREAAKTVRRDQKDSALRPDTYAMHPHRTGEAEVKH